MGEVCGKTMGTNRAARDGGEGTPAPLLPTVSTGPFALSAQPQPSEEANLALELLELPELETISSAVGRTKPARFRRSRIIWPLMLMSSGELEWRLWGKGTGRSQTVSGYAPKVSASPVNSLPSGLLSTSMGTSCPTDHE